MAERAIHLHPPYLGLVALGGFAGSAARLAITFAQPEQLDFPVATMSINVVGALALGALLSGLIARGDEAGTKLRIRLAVGTGCLGGFTTYSALAIDTQSLIADGATGAAAAYALGTVVLGAAAAWAGFVLVERRRSAAPDPA